MQATYSNRHITKHQQPHTANPTAKVFNVCVTVYFCCSFSSIAAETEKKERSMKSMDSNKAAQLERLGMGASGVRTVSHSASAAMDTIDQVAPTKAHSWSTASKRLGMTSSTGFFDR